ncbi:MAG: hypothetical protein IAF38_05820, partial [Bacteroidia bacterium]|nr:hypothetical protein [Bacteroidia bacterium]
KNGKGKIKNITTKQGELIIRGDKVKKDSNDVSYFKNLACIPCEFEDSKTIFRATRAKVIPDDKIVTGPMYLEISGVPTPIALPFGYFPNTKKRSKSGLIIPTYGESPNLGFYLKDGGFYWAMGPKIDMQFRGDIYTFGSWALKNFTNYNVRYKFTGGFSIGYSIFNIGEKEQISTFARSKDFFVRWTHNQDPKARPGITFNATVNAGTNSFNKLNAQNTGQYLNNTFASNISFSKSFKFGNISVNAQHSQNTQTKIVDVTLPAVTFNLNRFFPFKNETHSKQTWLDKLGVNYLLETKAMLSRVDTFFLKPDSPDKIKFGIHHSLPISTNFNLFKYFTFTPAMNLSAFNYIKTEEDRWDSALNKRVTDTLNGFKTAFDMNVSGSINTKIYGNYFFKGKHLKQIRHFLIPTVSFVYRPDMTIKELGYYKEVQIDTFGNSQKYSIFRNGIYGGPSSGRSGLLSFNLNNNLEAKIRKKSDTGFVDKKVVLLQNLSLSGGYDFMVTTFNLSNLSLSGRTKIWKNIDLLASGTFDPYSISPTDSIRQNVFQWNVNNNPARFSAGNIAINTAFSNSMFTKVKTSPELTNSVENKGKGSISPGLPWNINVYYNFVYSKPLYVETTTQTLNMSGDVAITQKWKIGFTTGYDFIKKNLSYTSLNIYRDLHCWEAHFDWVPFGFRKRYSVSINLKTSMLRDIKIPRTREWYDNL